MTYWEPIFENSLALKRFISDHTLNNDFYWHTVLTKILSCKFSGNLDPNDIIEEAPFLKNHPEPFRFAHKFIDWKNNISDHENWIRLNTLLASTAYLERYVYEIALIALSNDPGVIIGKSRTVNGVHFLKNNIQVKGIDIIEKFTKGTWDQRLKYLKSYFDFTNGFDQQTINNLDKTRIIRNKIAHRFGRDFITDIAHFIKSQEPLERISEKRLKFYLGLVNDVAKTIDDNIYKNHCGNFEIILFWHNWDKNEKHISWHSWTDLKKMTYGIRKYLNAPRLSLIKVKPIFEYYNNA